MGNLIPLCNLLKHKVILSLVKVRTTNECLQNDKSLVVSITLIRIFPCLSDCIKDLNDNDLTNLVVGGKGGKAIANVYLSEFHQEPPT